MIFLVYQFILTYSFVLLHCFNWCSFQSSLGVWCILKYEVVPRLCVCMHPPPWHIISSTLEKNYRQGNYSKLNQYRMITPLLILLLPCNILIMTVWCSLARNDVSWSGIINKSNIDFYLQGVLKCSQPNLLPRICISIIGYQNIGFGKSFGPKF